jgi:glycosyltransferase involved in cell wall biosynthesis
MEQPFFSILIPCYNAKKYLQKALDSCKNQFFEDFEVILCDNHSKDGVQTLLSEFKMDNFKYFLGKHHINTIELRNFLIKQANGKYIIWLEPFDELLPNTLKILFDNLYYQHWDILEFTTLLKSNEQQLEAKIEQNNEYIDDTCIDIYLNRNDMMQDNLWGKVFSASLMKNCLPEPYDIYSAEEAFYSLSLYYNAKSFKIMKTIPLYCYNIEVDHFHGLSTFNFINIKKLFNIRNEQLKRNLKFLKDNKLDTKDNKLACLDKLYLPNLLNDLINLEDKEERTKAFIEFNKYFALQISSNLLSEG